MAQKLTAILFEQNQKQCHLVSAQSSKLQLFQCEQSRFWVELAYTYQQSNTLDTLQAHEESKQWQFCQLIFQIGLHLCRAVKKCIAPEKSCASFKTNQLRCQGIQTLMSATDKHVKGILHCAVKCITHRILAKFQTRTFEF